MPKSAEGGVEPTVGGDSGRRVTVDAAVLAALIGLMD